MNVALLRTPTVEYIYHIVKHSRKVFYSNRSRIVEVSFEYASSAFYSETDRGTLPGERISIYLHDEENCGPVRFIDHT